MIFFFSIVQLCSKISCPNSEKCCTILQQKANLVLNTWAEVQLNGAHHFQNLVAGFKKKKKGGGKDGEKIHLDFILLNSC